MLTGIITLDIKIKESAKVYQLLKKKETYIYERGRIDYEDIYEEQERNISWKREKIQWKIWKKGPKKQQLNQYIHRWIKP